jgi:hypothetical protein
MITQPLIDAYRKGYREYHYNAPAEYPPDHPIAAGLEAVFDYLTETNQDDNGSDVRAEALRNAVATVALMTGDKAPDHPERVADRVINLADRYREWLTT